LIFTPIFLAPGPDLVGVRQDYPGEYTIILLTALLQALRDSPEFIRGFFGGLGGRPPGCQGARSGEKRSLHQPDMFPP
jgi:hypothetical protein